MNTVVTLSRAAGAALLFTLTACGTREALTDPSSDTAACELILLLPLSQTDTARALPQPVLDLLEPLPSPDGKWAWSPHPELRLLRDDGSVAAVFRAPAPESGSDRMLGRNLSADERTARFLEALADKPLRDLLPGAGGAAGPEAKPAFLKDAGALLTPATGETAPAVFCPAAAGMSREARAEACPATELAGSPQEMREVIKQRLPGKAAEVAPVVKVLVWNAPPAVPEPPPETPLAAAGPPPAPLPVVAPEPAPAPEPLPVTVLPDAPPTPAADVVKAASEEGRAAGTLESPVQNPASVTVNHHYETVVVLPEEPPANLTRPAEREAWSRLVKGAAPIKDAEFYFDFNSTDLDRENAAAVAHHARRIAERYRGQRVIVGGYSDEVGDENDCAAKALARAERVTRILKAAGIDATPAGYGKAPPDRGGPVTDPGARERRRCVILYLTNPDGEVSTEPPPSP